MKHPIRIILVIGLLLLPLAVAAQEELTETFISDDETFSFNYPEGWQIETDGLLGFVTLTDGDIELVFVGPAALGDSPDSEASGDLNATLAGFLDALDIDHEAPIAAKLEGQREATVANITYQDEPGTALGLRFQNDEMGIVLVSGTDVTLADAMPTLTAIVATFDSPALGLGCMVRTDQERAISLRVGPGINRGPIAFLPADLDFEVLGQATVDDGSLWFKLDKQEVAPKKSANEVWVAAADVTTSGECDAVGDAAAPPVIVAPKPPVSGEAGSVTLTVPGTSDWVDSGVAVTAGQTFTITASGAVNPCFFTFSGATSSDCKDYGPAGGIGPAQNVPGTATYPLPGANVVALLGRIDGGKPFLVSAGGVFTADSSGTLRFRVNDDPLRNNSGAFTVTIEVKP